MFLTFLYFWKLPFMICYLDLSKLLFLTRLSKLPSLICFSNFLKLPHSLFFPWDAHPITLSAVDRCLLTPRAFTQSWDIPAAPAACLRRRALLTSTLSLMTVCVPSVSVPTCPQSSSVSLCLRASPSSCLRPLGPLSRPRLPTIDQAFACPTTGSATMQNS